MEIIVKDGAKFVTHRFENENQFEKIALSQFKSIFGENAILFDKQKIRTATGIGTIPDAFVILPDKRKWFIIEVELGSHNVYQHIIPQITKFKNALDNTNNRRLLAKAFDKAIEDDLTKLASWFSATSDKQVFRLLTEIIEDEPQLLIIIDEHNEELGNCIKNLPFVTKVNIFKTFCREGFGLGDNIFLFDTFATAKKVASEKPVEAKAVDVSVVEGQQKERIKSPTPPATEWLKQISELREVNGLYDWTDICNHYKLHHKGNSARRALQTWVKKNKPNWAPVPDA